MSKSRLGRQVSLLASLVAGLLLPVVMPGSGILHYINMIYLMIIPAMSLNLILSTGPINFAHVGFVAIGAYASTLLSTKAELSWWLCLPLAGVTAALVAWALGWVILRIKGPYFFLVSVAFSQVVLLLAARFRKLTGGYEGIANIPKPSITIPNLFVFRFGSETSFYYLILVAMVVSVIVMYRLQHGHWGLTWRAIRENDMVAESAGVGVTRYKVVAFATGCFFAGITGSLYATYVSFISPDSFNLLMMFTMIMSVIVGGREYFYGPLIGTFLLMGLSDTIAHMAQYEPILYGTILVLVILFLPGGIASVPSQLAAKYSRIIRSIRRRPGDLTTS